MDFRNDKRTEKFVENYKVRQDSEVLVEACWIVDNDDGGCCENKNCREWQRLDHNNWNWRLHETSHMIADQRE